MSEFLTKSTELNTVFKQSVLKNKLHYPWIVIGFCSLFLFYKYIMQVSPSVMTRDLMRVFHLDGAGLGNLAAMYFYAYLITQLFAGPLIDRYSPKYLTAMAIAICALGALLFAHAHLLITAEIARILIGAGTAFATVSYMKMSSLWFQQKQVALVDGLLATAGMTGALCGQVPLTLLVAYAGWRACLSDCALLGLIITVLFLLFVKEKKINDAPADTSKKEKSSLFLNLFLLLKDKRNWLLTFYSGLAFTPLSVLGGLWGNPFFEEAHRLNPAEAASFTSCIFLGFAAGGPFFGFLSHYFDDKIKSMLYGTSLAFLSLTTAIYINALPLWAFGVLLFLFGLGTGAFMSCFAAGKEINSIKLAATVVALINTGDGFFGSFTEPMIGKFLDIFWKGKVINHVHYFPLHDFFIAFSMLPFYLLLALICLVLFKKVNAEYKKIAYLKPNDL